MGAFGSVCVLSVCLAWKGGWEGVVGRVGGWVDGYRRRERGVLN